MLVLWIFFEVYGHRGTDYTYWPKLVFVQRQNLVFMERKESTTENMDSWGCPNTVNDFEILFFAQLAGGLLSFWKFNMASCILIYSSAFNIFPFLTLLFASITSTTFWPLLQRLLMNWHSWVSKFSWISVSWLWSSFWKYLTCWFYTEEILFWYFYMVWMLR